MLEIPQRLSELFNKLLFDFEYFEYALLNGGLFGLISNTSYNFDVKNPY